jgi:hypothetical protein
MTEIKQKLFDAFREDHVALGSSFYALATCIRNDEITTAKEIAEKINIEAGPHIAFEEEAFYPALERFLEQDEIEAMYLEHENGRSLLQKIKSLKESSELSQTLKQELLSEVEKFEEHVSDCGELFGVMGGLSEAQLEQLFDRLTDYRLLAPSWLSLKSEAIDTTGTASHPRS